MNSNVIKIRREIYVRIAKLFFEDNLSKDVDRIPLEMRPKNMSESSRCCIYKDRAMIKYRIMAALGLSFEDEKDELTPLSEYAENVMQKEDIEDVHLTILSDLCSACMKTHYIVTEACRGCVARSCTLSCAKNAISIINGKARINTELCVGCGKCMSACSYQSIIRVPIPCEESCPTGAIHKNDQGKETIDEEKCILCGKCLRGCPFGAIAEKSQIVPVLKAIKSNHSVTALVAPSIAGQFPGSPEQLLTALYKLGFDSVIEVGIGAEMTAVEETKEFMERMENKEPFMTSSCCPAYVMAVGKHAQKLKPFVSTTPSPMIYTAKLAKKIDPSAKIVFIGPCLAKRSEAYNSEDVDLTLTFEELGALFVAKDIDVAECESKEWDNPSVKEGRLFAISGGVAKAIATCVDENFTFTPCLINGYGKKELKQLQAKLINQTPGNFIEVMTCEGGCIAGPGTIAKQNIACRSVERFAEKAESIKDNELVN